MERRRRVFSNVDKEMTFLRELKFCRTFFSYKLLWVGFFPPNGITIRKRELQQNDWGLPQNDHTICKVEVQFA